MHESHNIMSLLRDMKRVSRDKSVDLKSVQSTLSHLITTSVPRAMFTHFLVVHELSQYYLYWMVLPGGWIT